MPRKESLIHNDKLPDDLSQAELDVILKARPDLRKKIEMYQSLLAQKRELEAKKHGGFSQEDPMVFVRQVLGLKPTPAARAYGIEDGITEQQKRILYSIKENKRTAVPSGHGVGKTFLAGVTTLWFLYGQEDSIVITSAPTWNLVEQQLWREIRSLHSRSLIKLPGRMLTTQLEIDNKWYAIGMSSDEPERFRGFHGKRVLVIFDEATGVMESMYDEAESMIVGSQDRILLIGNPTNNASKFKQCCDNGMYNVISLDAREHPNVIHNDPTIIPGAVTRERIDDWLELYGGEDTPGFLTRARGRWAAADDSTLIPYDWITDAQEWDIKEFERTLKAKSRDVATMKKGASLGIDIAGPGSDLCVCWEIYNRRPRVLWWSQHREVMETAGKIVKTIRDAEGRYKALALDDTGIGNGVSSRLIEVQQEARKKGDLTDTYIDCSIIRVNFGSSPSIPKRQAVTRFWRIKDEMWWNIREGLRKKVLGLPPDTELTKAAFPKGNSLLSQLSTPIYTTDSAGVIHVYDKYHEANDRTKSLPRKSPDIAHGLLLAYHAYKTLQVEEEREEIESDPLAFRKKLIAEAMLRGVKKPAEEGYTLGPDDYDNL